jgi:predicted Zn-dependent protease
MSLNIAAGNTLANATSLTSSSTNLQVTGDQVYVSANASDFYTVSFKQRSSLNIALTTPSSSSGNVNVELLTSNGTSIIRRSDNSGTLSESINIADQPAGTYYLKIYTDSNSPTNYTLDLQNRASTQANLLWRNYGTAGDRGKTQLWEMNGVNPSQTVSLSTISDLNWQIAGTGDFNKDGQEDLVWRHYGTSGADAGKVVIWTMNGTSPVQTIVMPFLVSDPNWRIEGVADFNKDGQEDLVWRHYGTTGVDAGKVVIWTMNGTSPVQTIVMPFLVGDTNWRIEGVADFNKDGQEDLVWRHYGTTGVDAGKVVIWTMNGTSPVQTIVMPFLVSDPNWRIEGISEGYSASSRIDIAGNTTAKAFNIGTLSGAGIYKDYVSNADSDDYYQFNLTSSSHVSLSLDSLAADANLYLYNSSGSFISSSTTGGNATESINANLASGTYYVRIFTNGGNTDYRLNLSVPPSNGFDIKFDYRFDTIGWFTADKRVALEAAANVWKGIILDEFANIPLGTDLSVVNPQTGITTSLKSDFVIDDLLVFVGARDLGAGTLGLGGPSGSWIIGSDLNTRYKGSDFEPWTGFMSFNSSTNWFFDATPGTANDIPSSSYDFISVAVHELGHVLGIGGSDAFQNLVAGGAFTGSNAKARNGGNPIPLEYSSTSGRYAHIESGYSYGGSGEAAMDPEITSGVRKLPNFLDVALLDDIGYSVNYSIAPIASSITVTSPNGGNVLTAGSSFTISWTDNISENVRIDLYKGGSFNSTITSSTLSDGSEVWLLPNTLLAGSDYQIRISSTSNNGLFDTSDGFFTISPPPYITVTSPDGGNTLQGGSTYNITWTDNISENVRIDLYKGNLFHSTITSSTTSNGSYWWTVPTTLVGTDYRIRVTSTSNTNIQDTSNNNFSIKTDLKKYWFYYNFNASDYRLADSYAGAVIAPNGAYNVAVLDGVYIDSDFYDPSSSLTEVGLNGKYLVFGIEDYDDALMNEAGRVFIHNYMDRDNGVEQHFIPYKYSQGVQPSGFNYLGSEVDYIDAKQTTLTKFGQDYFETDPEATTWKAEFFNNLSLSGSPVYVEGFGSDLSFERQWGLGSPSARNNPQTVLSDGFSVRVSSKRYLNPGLYHIRTTSDDGIRVRVGSNLMVINSWIDQGATPPHSGYFYWAGGEAPITIEYYENAGGASLKFELMAATAIQDPVNSATNWATSVFSWDHTQSAAPPVNFHEFSNRRIGSIDLGSNVRSDGKSGISFNFGDGALDNNPTQLPDDMFAVRSYTSAYFDGSTYKFLVRGDDGFQILAKNQATNVFYYITSQGSWEQAYGNHVERTATLPQGWYDLHFHYFEAGGGSNFDLFWEKAANPDITIKLDFFGNFTQTHKDLINKAAQNWRNIITRDMVSSGVLNITITEGTTRMDGTAWNGVWALTDFPGSGYGYGQKPATPTRYNFPYSYDNSLGSDYHTRMHFNSFQLANSSWVNTYLVRLATHEIGHALYLDEAQYDSLLGLNGIMDSQGLDPAMTSGIYQRLEDYGYWVDRNASISWS